MDSFGETCPVFLGGSDKGTGWGVGGGGGGLRGGRGLLRMLGPEGFLGST